MTTQQVNDSEAQLAVGRNRAPLRRHRPTTSNGQGMHSESHWLGADGEVILTLADGDLVPPLPSARRSLKAPLQRHGSVDAVPKRALDLLGAITLALVFSPLMIGIALAAYWSGGSVMYRHRRVGRGGRTFECIKFRTMVINADQVLRELLERDPELRAEWARDHKLRNDPRITRLGRFLRRTSLDELPQIWNVLRGEMSLVGPRPIVREELLRYGRHVRAYMAVRPGITGLWQVTGRNDTNYRRRVVLDAYYVRKQNMRLDFIILLKTMRVVLAGCGAY